jgi:hypothetical protein
MDKTKCISLSFKDLSTKESMAICGGTTFAYDVGRVLRFLGISAQGYHGTSMAIIDWACTSLLIE